MNTNDKFSKFQIKMKRTACFVLAVIMLVAIYAYRIDSAAEATYTVTYKTTDVCGYVKITDSSKVLNVRKGPGLSYDVLKQLQPNTMVQIIGQTTVNSEMWYYIAYPTDYCKAYGFCNATNIGFVSANDDPEFEQTLTKAGFPESYKVYLRVVHYLHPNWIFELMDPNVEWSKDLYEQTKYRESYITLSSISSWKSNRDDNYLWDEDKYLDFEGTRTNASEALVAYYIDPRNFLNDQQIFQFEKLTYSESLNDVEVIEKILYGTFMYNKNIPGGYQVTETYIPTEEPTVAPTMTPTPTPTAEATGTPTETTETESTISPTESATSSDISTAEPTATATPTEKPQPTPTTRVVTKDIKYSEAFIEFGKEYNVSPLMLAARVRQEQGVNGTSALISGTVAGHEGYYNYFNIGASGNTPAIILENGMKEAEKEGWTSHYLALKGGSSKVGGNYIAKGQDTLYLQKFDLDAQYFGQFWHQYMQNIQAPTYECRNTLNTYKSFGLDQSALTFKIPILKNMPAMAAAIPTADGNCNYRLKSITIDGVTLSPTYKSSVFTYTATVYLSQTSVKVSAVPINSKTKIEGTGTVTLKVGENTIKLKTTSERGDTGEYKIVIKRLDYDPAPTATPTATATLAPTATPTPTAVPTATPNPSAGDASYTTTLDYVYNKDIDKDVVYGISEGTTVGELKTYFTLNNASIEIQNKLRQAATDDEIVSTGFYIKIRAAGNGASLGDLFTVIFGDVNGDGKIDEYDFVCIKRDVWDIKKLEDVYLVAGCLSSKDISKASDVTEYDFVMMKRHIWGISAIKQSR